MKPAVDCIEHREKERERERWERTNDEEGAGAGEIAAPAATDALSCPAPRARRGGGRKKEEGRGAYTVCVRDGREGHGGPAAPGVPDVGAHAETADLAGGY